MNWLTDIAGRLYDQAKGSVEKAGEKTATQNALDALKGSAAGYLTGTLGAPADYLSMVPLSPPEGGNPYAKAIRDLLGDPEKPFLGSQYLADKIGLGGEGLAYSAGQFVSPAAIKDLLKGAAKREIFAGEKAVNAPLDKLKRAKELDAAEVSSEDIWKETGWFKGPDEQWRWEIADKPAKFSMKNLNDWYKSTSSDFTTLDDLLKHPELYAAYPELKKLDVYGSDLGGFYATYDDWWQGKQINPDVMFAGFTHPSIGVAGEPLPINAGRIDMDMNAISDEMLHDVEKGTPLFEGMKPVENDLTFYGQTPKNVENGPFDWEENMGYTPLMMEKLRRYLLHELQHGVQLKEKFGSLPQTAYGRNYSLSPIEAEARAVENRALLNKKQRQEIFPLQSYDVPIEDLDIP